MKKNKKIVFVALSGGVDSAVAALLLKRQGYDVVGAHMRCYNVDGCGERDAEDARRVASHLKIPFYVFDFEEEYKRRVVDYMVEGYRRGETPNPDVMCNTEIKFGLFLQKACELGADYVATGHYVRRGQEFSIFNFQFSSKFQIPNPQFKTYHLYQAKDKNKDQSYFLWTLTQEQLRYCLFPIGDYLKSEVREIARDANLPVAEKKDSQGICFLGKVTLADFLRKYIPEKRGDVLTTAGVRIGEHRGAWYYTIGQRHGLNLGIKNYKLGVKGVQKTKAHYVAEKDVEKNTVTVAEGCENPALYRKELTVKNAHFINKKYYHILKNVGMLSVFARVRYRQPLVPAALRLQKTECLEIESPNSESGSHSKKPAFLSVKIRVFFDEPQKFIAPGQSAVFYTGCGEMLGGGVIV